jgi:hypothetical protein
MQSIGDIGFGLIGKKSRKSQRTWLLEELYGIYTHPRQEALLRAENKRRFVEYVKQVDPGALRDTRNLSRFSTLRWNFERAKLPKGMRYLTPMSPKSFAIRLSHLGLDELYYLISVSRDKNNRNESVGAFIFWSVRA